MLEIFNDGLIMKIKNSDGKIVSLDTKKCRVDVEGLDVDFPGEYEKQGILVEVKEYMERLFYSFAIEGNSVVVIFDENFEMKEEIMTFFGDVDILLVRGTKTSPKLVENIEARVVIPFGEEKEMFFHTLSQHKEEVSTFKLKGELPSENTEFINLK